MVRHGCTDLPLTDKNKDKAVQDILLGEVLVSRKTALDAIVEGMNTINLAKLVKTNPSVGHLVFPTKEQVEIDVEILKKKIRLEQTQQIDTEEKQKAYDWFLKFVSEWNKPRGLFILYLSNMHY